MATVLCVYLRFCRSFVNAPCEGPHDQLPEKRHGEYEATAPKHHWSGWYAAYIVAREQGRTPEEAVKEAALHMERAR
jgi:hypothetical protein